MGGNVAGEFEPSVERCRRKQTAKWHHVAHDVLPAWVAETDFDLCPAVADAIVEATRRGDVGYPDWASEPLADAFAERMASRHGWHPDPSHVRHTSDLIQAMQVVTELCTTRGDGVALHVPNYPPFLAAIDRMGRVPVMSPLVATGASWTFDAERLEDDVARARTKLLLLVNPHNPTGRVFTRAELEQLAAIAERHDLVVVSDELHAELTYPGHDHIPFASLGDHAAGRTVTITSATKSFNLGGMRTAVAHLGDARVRAAWDRLPSELLGSVNVLGVEATLAAWSRGDGWLERQRRHLLAMRDHLVGRLAGLPGVEVRQPEATYLAWLDCRKAGIADPAEHFRRRARVELVPGPSFGPGGDGHVRLNFGTGRAILDEIVDRMAASVQPWS
ncbi:MAG: aminotransferase class I/II-fold pyridoxal phosphate-dependent enzyme [Actinomycetota bacterium]|nr:aminotransferase class I/II-fold pyridoxal phosphate-dependent enzyme [Actinomycetota bacterium]